MTVSRGLDRGTVELCYVLVGYAGLGSSRRARYEPLHQPFRYFFSYPVPTQNGSRLYTNYMSAPAPLWAGLGEARPRGATADRRVPRPRSAHRPSLRMIYEP